MDLKRKQAIKQVERRRQWWAAHWAWGKEMGPHPDLLGRDPDNLSEPGFLLLTMEPVISIYVVEHLKG